MFLPSMHEALGSIPGTGKKKKIYIYIYKTKKMNELGFAITSL